MTHTSSRVRYSVRLAAIVAAALFVVPPRWAFADASKPRTFPSATDASDALFQAARNGDRKAIEAILGDKDNLASCGDESRDRRERERFVEKYQEMHRLVRELDGSTVLYVGAENWPFPIPLVSSRGRWHFDAETGRREITFRRIGADEATAIEVCRAAIEAAKHGETPANGSDPVVSFAARLATGAAADDQTFHGYRFVIVKDGGTTTVVAYPVEYRSSGVMTFVAGDDGIVYERDLGRDTARAAGTLKARPRSGWRAAA